MNRIFRAAATVAFGVVLGAWLGAAQAQSPRVTRIVVPFGPGGAPDLIARALAQELSSQTGQSFIVDNRGGANGVIGTDAVAKAAPDGATLLLHGPSFVVNPSLYKKLPFDPLKDLAPIANICSTEGMIMVINPSLPAKNLREFIALAKQPGAKFAFGSPGVGNTMQLAAESFQAKIGSNMVHVPYKGAGEAVTALIGGEIQMMFLTPPPALPQIKGGKLRAIGYTHSSRARFLPDTPTMAEAGLPMDFNGGWYGLWAPAGTPPETISRLNAGVRKALSAPGFRDNLANLGLDPVGNSPEEFRSFLRDQMAFYGALVKQANIQPE